MFTEAIRDAKITAKSKNKDQSIYLGDVEVVAHTDGTLSILSEHGADLEYVLSMIMLVKSE